MQANDTMQADDARPLLAEITDQLTLRIARVQEAVIEHARADAFKSFLEGEVFHSPVDVLLVLDDVTYLSSIALGLISLAAVMTEKRGIQFVVVCSREAILKLFVISGLYRAVKVSNSVESAKLKLAHPQGERRVG